ncbi:MAG: hypothetical protein N2510_03910 [Ignavibacteria bacterium]|nr:hypothetical protein [Ignavibacteria bacterium]
MGNKSVKYFLFIIIISQSLAYSQKFSSLSDENYFADYYLNSDTLKKKVKYSKQISGLFISAGTGLSVPVSDFSNSANPSFGITGRIEYASTSIFPLVIGADVSYFTHNAPDEFKTGNLLNNFKTKILSAGLNIEYCLINILRSSFTIPFFVLDVKYNIMKREYDENRQLENIQKEENKVSIGTGIGFTMFIFDFYGKYHYMKNSSYIGFYVKTKIPVIRF